MPFHLYPLSELEAAEYIRFYGSEKEGLKKEFITGAEASIGETNRFAWDLNRRIPEMS